MIINAQLNGKQRSVVIRDGKIVKIGSPSRHADINEPGNIIIPGLVDVHTHGMMGIDAMDCDFAKLSLLYAQHGTTTFYATTMTMPFDRLLEIDRAASLFQPCGGANLAGIHYEGPFISKDRCGAQKPEDVLAPDFTLFSQLENARMVTIAPETDGAIDFISKASAKCVCSIGHTNCTCSQALEAFDSGASCLTHMFNAMPPMLHRAPGPIGAAVERQSYVQLISDGMHVSRQAVLATFRMFPGKVVLISDSIKPAGLSEGVFDCGGVRVHLEDGKALIDDGHFAGSTSSLLDCVRKAVEFGVPMKDAVDAATATPARMMGLSSKGVIAKGYDADILVVDKDLRIKHVIAGGKEFRPA